MSNREKAPIGELLVAEGVLDRVHLERALAWQRTHGGRIIEILMEQGDLDPHVFVKFLASSQGVPSFSVRDYSIDRNVTKLVPREYATQRQLMPLDRMGKQLTVAMVCPLDKTTIEELEQLTQLRVRAFLCTDSDLNYMLERYYGSSLEEEEKPVWKPASPAAALEQRAVALRVFRMLSIVRNVDSLPRLPATLQKCEEAMGNPEISVRDIGLCIEADPPLAASILRAVNSPAFGFGRRIASIMEAVAALGMRETYRIALAAALLNILKVPRGFDANEYQRSSMFTATYCRLAAEVAHRKGPAAYFTAGLLRELGRIVLMTVAPEAYSKVGAALHGPKLIAAETAAMGIGYPEAGYLLANSWNLPPELCEAIRFQYTPENAVQAPEMVELVALVSDMVDSVCMMKEPYEDFLSRNDAVLARVGITPEAFLQLAQVAEKNVNLTFEQ